MDAQRACIGGELHTAHTQLHPLLLVLLQLVLLVLLYAGCDLCCRRHRCRRRWRR